MSATFLHYCRNASPYEGTHSGIYGGYPSFGKFRRRRYNRGIDLQLKTRMRDIYERDTQDCALCVPNNLIHPKVFKYPTNHLSDARLSSYRLYTAKSLLNRRLRLWHKIHPVLTIYKTLKTH